MSAPAKRTICHGRLPQHPQVHAEFLRRHIGRYAPNAPDAPAPVAATTQLGDAVNDFIDTIKKDDDMYSLCNMMFRQVSKDERWATTDENCHVHDLDHLHRALTSAVSAPPEVYVVKDTQGKEIGEAIGLPIYLILDPLSNTGAAYDLFRMRKFNAAVKKLLNAWGDYLKDENSGSNSTLNARETGWFGQYGMETLLSGLRGLSFEETYGVKPEEAQAKYKSWDAFFTREFKDIKILRPLHVPDTYTPIYNSCDSFLVRTAHNVKLDDTFWLKGQNYSLYDMFGGDPLITKESLSAWAPKFVGASVYQGALTATDYHRWHSPIKGTVLDTTVLPGTYYAALLDEGAPENSFMRTGDPRGAMLRSLPWLSLAATRGVIIMEPQDESSPIALIAFVAIGMMEVSTIDITVSKDGADGKAKHVDAGDEIGIFHFGGSSFVTVIKPKDGHEVVFKGADDQDVVENSHYWVNEIVGRVVPTKEQSAGSQRSCVIC